MSRTISATAFVAALVALSFPAVVSNRSIDDWPQWRGRNRDGIAAEKGLAEDVAARAGRKLAWTGERSG